MEDVIGQKAQGGGDANTPDLHLLEAGDSGRVGGLTDYFRGMCEGDSIQGRVEAPVSVEEGDGRQLTNS